MRPSLVGVPTTKSCAFPELFVIPAPLIVNRRSHVTVKALAPALKIIWFTSVFADGERLVVADEPNVAVSLGPLGTAVGVQLSIVFQSPVIGTALHVALSARLVRTPHTRTHAVNILAMNAQRLWRALYELFGEA